VTDRQGRGGVGARALNIGKEKLGQWGRGVEGLPQQEKKNRDHQMDKGWSKQTHRKKRRKETVLEDLTGCISDTDFVEESSQRGTMIKRVSRPSQKRP